MKGYQKGLWRVPGLKELRKKNESEGQKKAKTSGERRPMAGAAMLAHFKELEGEFRRLPLKELCQDFGEGTFRCLLLRLHW